MIRTERQLWVGPGWAYFTSVRNHILGLKILINIRPLSIDGAMLIYAFYTQGLIPTAKIWYFKACLAVGINPWV